MSRHLADDDPSRLEDQVGAAKEILNSMFEDGWTMNDAREWLRHALETFGWDEEETAELLSIVRAKDTYGRTEE